MRRDFRSAEREVAGTAGLERSMFGSSGDHGFFLSSAVPKMMKLRGLRSTPKGLGNVDIRPNGRALIKNVATAAVMLACVCLIREPVSPQSSPNSLQLVNDETITRGWTQYRAHEYITAIDTWKSALLYLELVREKASFSDVTIAIGAAYAHIGFADDALPMFRNALTIKREMKSRPGETMALVDLGIAELMLGRSDNAIADEQEALVLSRELKDQDLEARALRGIGSADIALGHYEEALDAADQALTINRAADDAASEQADVLCIASTERALHRYDASLLSYERALSLSRASTNSDGNAEALDGVGRVYADLGDYDDARLSIKRAIGETDNAWLSEALYTRDLADIDFKIGSYDEALVLTQQERKLFSQLKYRFDEARSLLRIGRLQEKLRHYYDGLNETSARRSGRSGEHCAA